jgi:hypothetical protein
VVDALSREPLGKLNGRVHEYTTLAFLRPAEPPRVSSETETHVEA